MTWLYGFLAFVAVYAGLAAAIIWHAGLARRQAERELQQFINDIAKGRS